MVARVEKTEAGLAVLITPEMIRTWNVKEGSEVEMQPVEKSEHRYMTIEEGMEAYRRTLPLHESTYRALAKI